MVMKKTGLLSVILSFGIIASAQDRNSVYSAKSLNDDAGWYRIDVHVHTTHSDGSNTPGEVIDLAKASGLDGLISTDHNTVSAYKDWGKVQDPDILVINGMEATNRNGHWNVFGQDSEAMAGFYRHYTDTSRYEKAIGFAESTGLFTVVNHPYLPSLEFWYDKSRLRGIEVWNNYWDPSDDKAVSLWHNLLVSGIYRVIVGGSDFHNTRDQVLGTPHTAVYAESLSDQGIIEGIASGKSYIAKDASVTLTMTAEAEDVPGVVAGLGDYLVCGTSAVVHFRSSVPGKLYLFNQNGLCLKQEVEAGQSVDFRMERGSAWVRAELRDAEGNMLALTNPIFMGEENRDFRYIP